MTDDSSLRYLVFTPDNPNNTTIKDRETDEILYKVRSVHDKHTVTKVYNADNQVIASWQWREVRSDLLTIGDSTPVASSAWLKKSMIPFKDTVYLTDGEKRKCKWKGNAPGLQLELFAESDKTNPIASFHRPVRTFNKSVTPPVLEITTPAMLVLDPRGDAIRDIVLISFCLLEKERRIGEAETVNRAESHAIPDVTI